MILAWIRRADAFLRRLVGLDDLEALVAERTGALEASRAELAKRVAELETARVRLSASDRLAAVGRLSRGLAHEINNPLAVVQANLEYLSGELEIEGPAREPPEELREAVHEAVAASRRVTQIVKDLMAFSREPGDDQGPSDLATVLEHVKRLVSHEVRARARLEVRIPEGTLLVRGSAAALGQVFSRLVLDAAAALPAGLPEPGTVSVRVVQEASGVTVQVHDGGDPIPAEVLPHVFDPFFTPTPGFTAGRGGRGVGVGLAACYGLVEAVGGSISVESAPGRGTTFRVRLPAATSATRLALRTSPGGPSRRRERVLVVGEDPHTVASLYRVLSARFDVVPHTSPGHVLTLLGAGERFDRAVCDASLRDGFAEPFFRALSAADPALARDTVFLVEGSDLPGFVACLPNLRAQRPPGPALLELLGAPIEAPPVTLGGA